MDLTSTKDPNGYKSVPKLKTRETIQICMTSCWLYQRQNPKEREEGQQPIHPWRRIHEEGSHQVELFTQTNSLGVPPFCTSALFIPQWSLTNNTETFNLISKVLLPLLSICIRPHLVMGTKITPTTDLGISIEEQNAGFFREPNQDVD